MAGSYRNFGYEFSEGQIVVHRLFDAKCLILRQLPRGESDEGFDDFYLVRMGDGSKRAAYGIELDYYAGESAMPLLRGDFRAR